MNNARIELENKIRETARRLELARGELEAAKDERGRCLDEARRADDKETAERRIKYAQIREATATESVYCYEWALRNLQDIAALMGSDGGDN